MKTKQDRAHTCSRPPMLPNKPAAAPPRRRSSRKPAGLSREELQQWVEKAKNLPDLRWEKVQAVRDALKNNQYDADGHLAELADKMPEELIEFVRRNCL